MHLYPNRWSFSIKNEHRGNCWYIERNTNIKIFQNIADTIGISGTYSIFSFGVKPKARKMWLYENEKGESIGPNSPFWVWISSRYPKCILREFRSNYSCISWPSCPLEKRDITTKFRLWKVGVSWRNLYSWKKDISFR